MAQIVTSVVNIACDEYDVYIGRPSIWGNPFKIGRDGTRVQCLDLYKDWILNQPGLLANLHILRGKRLGCYCAPERCHGNILAVLCDTI